MPDTSQGKMTPISRGLVYRTTSSMTTVVRNAIRGVSDAWFGPGQPIQPMAPDIDARRYDYAYGGNLQYNPRSGDDGGSGITFAMLRSLADNLPLLRGAIETRKDQILNTQWSIRLRDKDKEKENRKKKVKDDRIQEITDFLTFPDKENAFGVYTRSLCEEMLVTDATCVYPRANRGGGLYALEQVDGATIKLLIDADGRTPLPPDPAYQQILHGIPATDFTRDELMYMPRNKRVHKLYGYSPVEQIIMTVNIALRRDVSTLEYYKSGTVPDAFISMPREWSVDQVKTFQEYFDFLMMGNLAERRKARFLPGGADTKIMETKAPPLKDQYDEWLARIICWALNVTVSPLVSQVNRATGETLKIQATEEGLQPTQAWLKSIFDMAIWKYYGYTDLEFVWENADQTDILKVAQEREIYGKMGLLGYDEIRDDMGRDSIGVGNIIVTAMGPVPLVEGVGKAIEDIKNPPEPPPQLVAPGVDPKTGKAVPPIDDKSNDKGVGKLADVPFGGEGGLRKKVIKYPGLRYDRPSMRKARKRLTAVIAKTLKTVRASVIEQVRSDLTKAEETARQRARRISEELDLSGFTTLVDPTEAELAAVGLDASDLIMGQLGVTSNDELVNRVNQKAANYAQVRAAEMVGLRYDEDGNLVEAVNAEYRIDDTTRDMIRQTIGDGLDGNVGIDEIIADLEDDFGFSESRAEMIARTEITRANNQASLTGAKEANDEYDLGLQKSWLTAGDEDVDEEICQANEDEGLIDLDEDFPSGDDAPPGHPRCRCTLIYERADTPDDTSDDEEDSED